ncbi:2-hydroxyacid dehydrogenase [Phenylobacterium sp.]|jgi:lactate dehydrogenase-like 2-hydroxyacid dehydrogenase|uniref:2-hydroxyacid dehydrogenase n=1 Tax=Phenylobacterium sp. TaxID=1871053 RepID=UPI002F3E7B61
MPAVEKPAVLVVQPMLLRMQPELEALGARMVVGWDAPAEDLAQVRALLHFGPVTREQTARMPKLGLIAVISAGYDGIDLDWCRARGVAVTHSRGVNADDVADHALGLLLAAWRGIVSGDRFVREGRWADERQVQGSTLTGRRVGIVGLGHIGLAAARRVEAFGMSVAWWGPNPKPAPWPRAESVLALAEDSDILVVACRAAASNVGLISREVIEAVGPKGLIVNVARGSVVDEDALIAALRSGRLGNAALDVFEQEPTPADRWAGLPGVVLTPHSAGGAVETVPRMMALALENIRLHLAGEPLTAEVPAQTSSRP